jgi:hypothetical protein
VKALGEVIRVHLLIPYSIAALALSGSKANPLQLKQAGLSINNLANGID